MDANKLKDHVSNPSSIRKTDLTDIKESLAKYPYCSTLHMLYLKGLSNTNDIGFDEALRKSSIHVNDREQLFNIINNGAELKVGMDNDNVAVKEELKPLLTSNADEKTAEVTLDEQNHKIGSDDEKELGKEENIEVAEKTEFNQTKHTIESELEKEIVASALDTSLIFSVENINEKGDEPELIQPVEPIKEPIELDFSSSKTEIDLSIGDESESPQVDLEKLSFSEWLAYKKANIDSKNTELDSNTKETEPQPEEITHKEDKAVPEPKLTKKEINQLLDKFIQEEPRLSKPKKDFYDPLTSAKESLDDSDILVSETLAKIYHLQKNYSKAIKAYEQLSLLKPKKKSFFANQIKKIRKEELK